MLEKNGKIPVFRTVVSYPGSYKLMFLSLLLLNTTALAFDVQDRKFNVPAPAAVCSSNEAMFSGASVVYSDCSNNIDIIVVSKIDSNHSFADLRQFISSYQPDRSSTDYDVTDALFDGTIVAITQFDKNMRVFSNGKALQFFIADRTVYLVKNERSWLAITVLPN